MRYPYPSINCTARVARIYIQVRWSRGQPIRGQLYWTFDQSEASEYAGPDDWGVVRWRGKLPNEVRTRKL